MLIQKNGVSYGLVSGGISCPACKHRFGWEETRRVKIGEENETMKLYGPGCQKCGVALPIKALRLPIEHCQGIAQAAAQQHNPPKTKAAVAGVWGQKAGLLAAMAFPSAMSDETCGARIDEFMVSEGWPERYGTTWIRCAVWKEAEQRGGQAGERIMVHYDGRALNWSPVSDWVVIAPKGMLDG